MAGPPRALAINVGRAPFVIALNVATLAALPLCGALWHGGPSGINDWQPDPFTWHLFAVGYVVTLVAVLATRLRAFAGLVPLLGVPLLAGVWAYARNPDRRVYNVMPLFELPSVWGMAIALALLAALAGSRRGTFADAHDRNGWIAGVWLAATGVAIAMIAFGTHDWLRTNELISGDVTGTTGRFVGLRRMAFVLGLVTTCCGAALTIAAMVRRHRRRRFLAAVVEGRLTGWSIEQGDDPTLPLFLDPSQKPTAALVRGGPGDHGPRIARVRA